MISYSTISRAILVERVKDCLKHGEKSKYLSDDSDGTNFPFPDSSYTPLYLMYVIDALIPILQLDNPDFEGDEWDEEFDGLYLEICFNFTPDVDKQSLYEWQKSCGGITLDGSDYAQSDDILELFSLKQREHFEGVLFVTLSHLFQFQKEEEDVS